MPDDRRSFIKRFGITLGSLIVSGSLPGCGPRKEAGVSDTESRITKQSDPPSTPHGPEWEQLRQCWLSLNDQDTRDALLKELVEALGHDRGFTAGLGKRHQAILDTLVVRGQLEESVAKYMQMAFEEAVYHTVRSMGTCYFSLPFEYHVRKDLLQQADVLRKISDGLDPAAVAKAYAAIAQDVAFFESSKTESYDYRARVENYEAGNLKASPEALEAARLLTQLLLGASE